METTRLANAYLSRSTDIRQTLETSSVKACYPCYLESSMARVPL